MRCNKRIAIVPDRAETYCQRELGHNDGRPCSINRDQSYPPGTIVGIDLAVSGSEKTVIIRRIAGGRSELCAPARGFEHAEHPAPLSWQLDAPGVKSRAEIHGLEDKK